MPEVQQNFGGRVQLLDRLSSAETSSNVYKRAGNSPAVPQLVSNTIFRDAEGFHPHFYLHKMHFMLYILAASTVYSLNRAAPTYYRQGLNEELDLNDGPDDRYFSPVPYHPNRVHQDDDSREPELYTYFPRMQLDDTSDSDKKARSQTGILHAVNRHLNPFSSAWRDPAPVNKADKEHRTTLAFPKVHSFSTLKTNSPSNVNIPSALISKRKGMKAQQALAVRGAKEQNPHLVPALGTSAIPT